MAGWSTQEMLDGVQSTLNLAKIGATDLGTASDILTKILVGLVEILFKKYSVNCWKAKLIFVIYGINMLISNQAMESRKSTWKVQRLGE
jgi:hypothetical protein|nr:MAG TPA: minor tail protein [Caudoviricetes sp.]